MDEDVKAVRGGRILELQRQRVSRDDPTVSTQEFEALVDTSLKMADRVDLDDQSAKGDLWLLRGCKWVYAPFRFRLAYHVFHGALSVVYFQSQRSGELWKVVKTTDDYRRMLEEADRVRRAAL